MGFLDRLFGTETAPAPAQQVRERSDDERALERYRYLLRTAPPETLEQVHAEAFAKLTDEQRAQIYAELSQGAGTGERPLSSEPATLARAATRAELRNPGTLERSFAGAGRNGAPGFGSMVGSSLLGTVAGYVIGSALVSAFLPWDAGYDGSGDPGSADGGSGDGRSGSDASDASADASADVGAPDFGVSDFGDFDF